MTPGLEYVKQQQNFLKPSTGAKNYDDFSLI